jgi:hypothetical protein
MGDSAKISLEISVNLTKKKIAPFALYVGVKRIYILIEIFF